MTERELLLKVGCAHQDKVRDVLKEILKVWYVEDDGEVNLDKELGSDELGDVTNILEKAGFTPKE